MKALQIQHTTHYGFSAPVALGSHRLFLRPRDGHDLRIIASRLDIDPPATSVTWRRDLYDNVLGLVAFENRPVPELRIESRVDVELYESMPLNFVVEDHAFHFPLHYRTEEEIALRPYLEALYAEDSRLTDWLGPLRRQDETAETFGILDQLNRIIHTGLNYELRVEEGVLAPGETLERGRGSCRDLAVLFLESCRRLGIAARFVGGYVHVPATEIGGASSHAWAEVYLPGAGWKGFDPTLGRVVGPDHIPVAVHRHPEAISPVAGTFTGPKDVISTLTIDVQVTPLAPS